LATVSIVPSTGRITPWYAVSRAATKESAIERGERVPAACRAHAAVAACTHEGAAGYRPGYLTDAAVGHGGCLCHRRPEGEHHIGAGVAVGHGEDVQCIDGLGVVLKPGEAGLECLSQRVAVTAPERDLRTTSALLAGFHGGCRSQIGQLRFLQC